MSQQRDYKNSFESRQRAALSALVLLVALVLSCLGAAVAVSKALKGTEMNLAQAQIGSMIYVAAAYILFAVYMAVYQRDTFDGAKLMTMVCIQLALMPWMQVLGNMLEPHVTPMVMAVLLIAELVNHKTALAAGVLLGLESAVLAGGKEGLFTTAAAVMMAANIASCAASVFALKRINTRGGMIAASGIGGAAGAAVTAAIYIALGATVREILTYAGCVLFSALFSGLFVTGSLTIWEELFDIATPARLNELLNTGNPLLKQLMYDAPGTYQHCMNVAALAEGAAEKIGANALLAKVGAAYHDVGKLRRPQYFKENQQAENIHDTLSPQESASIIIAHQKDGATILLPQGGGDRPQRKPQGLPLPRQQAQHQGGSHSDAGGLLRGGCKEPWRLYQGGPGSHGAQDNMEQADGRRKPAFRGTAHTGRYKQHRKEFFAHLRRADARQNRVS